MYIIHHFHHVVQRDISTIKLRIHKKKTIVSSQDSKQLICKEYFLRQFNSICFSKQHHLDFKLYTNNLSASSDSFETNVYSTIIH